MLSPEMWMAANMVSFNRDSLQMMNVSGDLEESKMDSKIKRNKLNKKTGKTAYIPKN